MYIYSVISIMYLLCSPKKFGGAYSRRLVRQSVSPSIRLICVRSITLLFEVRFRNYFKEMTTMLRRRVARKIWVPTLKVKVTARPYSKNFVPITLLFKVGFKKYLTEIITISRQRVARNIWVATLKVKVTA